MHQDDMTFCINVARLLARRSRATRAKVGCVIWNVKLRTIVSVGYNGTAAGEDNLMEMNGKTLDTVIHAEENALKKLSFWTRKRNLVLFVTHAPCLKCARAIVKLNVPKVYYLENYGTPEGLHHLREHQVDVKRLLML